MSVSGEPGPTCAVESPCHGRHRSCTPGSLQEGVRVGLRADIVDAQSTAQPQRRKPYGSTYTTVVHTPRQRIHHGSTYTTAVHTHRRRFATRQHPSTMSSHTDINITYSIRLIQNTVRLVSSLQMHSKVWTWKKIVRNVCTTRTLSRYIVILTKAVATTRYSFMLRLCWLFGCPVRLYV